MAKINLTGMFFFPKIVLSLHAHWKGEMAEWSIAGVLKTVEVQASGVRILSLRKQGCRSASYAIYTFFYTQKNVMGLNLFVNRFSNINSYSIQS